MEEAAGSLVAVAAVVAVAAGAQAWANRQYQRLASAWAGNAEIARAEAEESAAET